MEHLPGQRDESHHRAKQSNRLAEVEQRELARLSQGGEVKCEQASPAIVFRSLILLVFDRLSEFLNRRIRREMRGCLGRLIVHGLSIVTPRISGQQFVGSVTVLGYKPALDFPPSTSLLKELTLNAKKVMHLAFRTAGGPHNFAPNCRHVLIQPETATSEVRLGAMVDIDEEETGFSV